MSLEAAVLSAGTILLLIVMGYITLHCIRCHNDPTFFR